MVFFTAILPMLVLAITVLVIVILLPSKNRSKLSRKLWTPKRIYVVVSLYVVIGVIGLIYTLTFSKQTVTALSEDELSTVNSELKELYKYAQINDSTYLDDKYIKKNWSYDISGNQLQIDLPADYNHNNDIRIRYNEKQSPNKINITYYQFPFIEYNIDFTDKISLPNISIIYRENRLSIENPQVTSILHYSYSPTLLMLHQTPTLNEEFPNFFISNGLILIDVPKNMVIIDPTGGSIRSIK